jgi:molybdopterin-guanine dinucleotide biosynthesis protein A
MTWMIQMNFRIIITNMLTIVINAGGESSRMGENKALKPFAGKPLIARMVERLRSVADELVVTTNQPEGFEFLDLALVADVLPGKGALGGLYTAVSAAGLPLVAVVACDMPFINPGLIAAQRDLLVSERVDVVIPVSPEGLEPLHAVYRKETCLPAIQAALEAGKMRVTSWFPYVKVREMLPQEVMRYDPQFQSFINVNTPQEFEQAEGEALRQAREGRG